MPLFVKAIFRRESGRGTDDALGAGKPSFSQFPVQLCGFSLVCGSVSRPPPACCWGRGAWSRPGGFGGLAEEEEKAGDQVANPSQEGDAEGQRVARRLDDAEAEEHFPRRPARGAVEPGEIGHVDEDQRDDVGQGERARPVRKESGGEKVVDRPYIRFQDEEADVKQDQGDEIEDEPVDEIGEQSPPETAKPFIRHADLPPHASPRKPLSYWITARTATAAVSTRSTLFPKLTEKKPACRARSVSSFSNPPSGPMTRRKDVIPVCRGSRRTSRTPLAGSSSQNIRLIPSGRAERSICSNVTISPISGISARPHCRGASTAIFCQRARLSGGFSGGQRGADRFATKGMIRLAPSSVAWRMIASIFSALGTAWQRVISIRPSGALSSPVMMSVVPSAVACRITASYSRPEPLKTRSGSPSRIRRTALRSRA